MVARDFGLRAYARQLVKDMHMVETLSGKVGLGTPMLRQSCAMYEALLERGGAGRRRRGDDVRDRGRRDGIARMTCVGRAAAVPAE
jgi:hypothetical protein